MSELSEQAAIAALSKAHAADPRRVEGRAVEELYVERLESWLGRLVPSPSYALRLAAHCQHLERWAIQRSEYPLGRAGYHRWRVAVQQRQGARAREILGSAGCSPELASRVAALVSKTAPREDAEAQALEDAACLVFLVHELEPFAAQHGEYPRAKHLVILRKTWRKMSLAGRELALAVPLPEPVAALLREVAKKASSPQ